jgi:hypothetical protein
MGKNGITKFFNEKKKSTKSVQSANKCRGIPPIYTDKHFFQHGNCSIDDAGLFSSQ